MTSAVMNDIRAAALLSLALAACAMGLYVAKTATEPGGAVLALLLMIGAVTLGIKGVRHRLPTWVARTALAVGVPIATFTAFVSYDVAEPLFARAQDVPSVIDSAPSPNVAAAVEVARELARTAVVQQNLPGVSIAVGMGGAIVWAEGFGWRDVVTKTPVTPKTRVNIGTAASVVPAATIAPLRLTNTGAESAVEWSPEQIGEPGEDFPLFTMLRHLIFQPIGVASKEYPLPGDRATFYVPRSDDDPLHGRRLMSMRDLACCAGTMAFYSTPSDLVRLALATNAGSVNGELAGGSVMSLMTRRDRGIVVVVASNVAHANTAGLALKVADVFAGQK